MLHAAERLSARERLEAIMDSAVASGNLKPGESRAHMRRLDREARGQVIVPTQMPDEAPPQTSATEELRSFGFEVKRV